jgi:hypothetical protein
MRSTSLHVSLETILAASSLLGHELEDRSSIRLSQDLDLYEHLIQETARPLRGRSQRNLFCVAPLDILVSETDGRKRFHLLELNGTGIGGISNMPDDIVQCVMASLSECSGTFNNPDGVVLLAVSGKESAENPRLNRLMHEKLLFVEAMREGLTGRFGSCDVANLDQLAAQRNEPRMARPTVLIGYMKDLLDAMNVDGDGRLWLHGRPVMGAVNDRFCRNVMQRFDEQVDLNLLKTFNRCFAAGSDKGIAYGLLDEYVREHPHPSLPEDVLFAHADSRDELIDTVLHWLRLGRQVVIKPHGTGLGHGIEFFFSRKEPFDDVIDRIDRSLKQTEEYYGVRGGALPYTVCEYVDACTLSEPGHPLDGHKYELRVAVYRDDDELKAMPSIAKVARERVEADGFVRRALINNITASGDTGKVCGTDYMLPLCNWRTLELLDLTEDDLHDLCGFATGYVSHVLDQLETAPHRFGLPDQPLPQAEGELLEMCAGVSGQ